MVIFDLQNGYTSPDSLPACVTPAGSPPPSVVAQVFEDITSLFVSDRDNWGSGVGIHVAQIEGVQPGDRLTVTGRFGLDAPSALSWGVALVAKERDSTETQLAHYIAPRGLFSLSHILDTADMNRLLIVQTSRWRLLNPIMDFHIDNILITRASTRDYIKEDTRKRVYSLNKDAVIRQRVNENEWEQAFVQTQFLQNSGTLVIRAFEEEGYYMLHCSNRVRDFDGIDIMLRYMNLQSGNTYTVTVNGRVDGKAAEGARFMLQGVPGYSWRCDVPAITNGAFSLTHTLTRSEVEKWTALRVSTNAYGAPIAFFIDSIEIECLGMM